MNFFFLQETTSVNHSRFLVSIPGQGKERQEEDVNTKKEAKWGHVSSTFFSWRDQRQTRKDVVDDDTMREC